MTPQRIHVGRARSPVVIVDDATGDWHGAASIAAALAPFPPARGTYYPGLRRIIADDDAAAMAYVVALLEAAARFIAGGFDADRFDLVEASFSIVTTPPAALTAAQRVPHFDSTDPRYIAVLHYLSATPATGTAFYRQRSTGIERVDRITVDRFIAAARAETARPNAPAGYIAASNDDYEQIGAVEGLPDRLLIYQGALLHSGIIPADMPLSADPAIGRLTANLFIQLH